MSAIKNLKGETFGNFLVIGRTNTSDGKQRAFWNCKCLVCGKHYDVRGDNLRRGISTKCCNCNGGAGRGSREIV